MKYVRTVIATIVGVIAVILIHLLFFKGIADSYYVIQIIIGTFIASLIGKEHQVIQGVFIALIIYILSVIVNSDFYASNLNHAEILTDTGYNLSAGLFAGFIFSRIKKLERKSEKIEYPLFIRMIVYIASFFVIQYFVLFMFLQRYSDDLFFNISLALFIIGFILFIISVFIIIIYRILKRRRDV